MRKKVLSKLLACLLSAAVAIPGLGFTAIADHESSAAFPDKEAVEAERVAEKEEEIDLVAYNREGWRLINGNRADRGLPGLKGDETLSAMAQKRAEELLASYSHTRPDGRGSSTVYGDFKCGYKAVGEIIGYANMAPDVIVSAWMDSDGHRKIILRDDAVYGGIACVEGENGRVYWAMLFAKDKKK